MFFEDEDKIGYGQAEKLIESYIEERGDTTETVTAKAIMNLAGIEPSKHNRVRVIRCLENNLEPADIEIGQRSPRRFRIPSKISTEKRNG